MVTKEEFNKVWKDSTKEDILNQFYYEHIAIRKAIEYIKENTEEYRHDIDLKDKRLNIHTTQFINNLLNILQNGSENDDK